MPTPGRKNDMTEDELIWQEEEREVLADYRIFKAVRVRNRSYGGKLADFYQLQSPDWVTVITRNEQGMFLMVRQFRMGSASLSLEFPAGVIESGEPPEDAARRELREETGHSAGQLKCIGSLNPNPAFMTNTSYTYLATELEDLEKTEWDENEIIESLWMSEKEIDRIIGRGEMNSAIMVQAWFWYKRVNL